MCNFFNTANCLFIQKFYLHKWFACNQGFRSLGLWVEALPSTYAHKQHVIVIDELQKYKSKFLLVEQRFKKSSR
jgi:hypothetical protein